ncbi:MAG TPA: hypothetical protein DCG53_12025 [Syntrophus sp. (in: bacteria)]|nr:hypothetical protein [Syntrophus sp. (in: bacteria)]
MKTSLSKQPKMATWRCAFPKHRPSGRVPIFLLLAVLVAFSGVFFALPGLEIRTVGAEDYAAPKEGLFVKKYPREELLKLLAEPGGWFSSQEGLIDYLKHAGLITSKEGNGVKKEWNILDLRDFTFHNKGRFEFVRYSKDGKSLFVSYMYPTKNADNKDYAPNVFNRNVLVQWDTSTGRLAVLWMSEKNPARAVTMSEDETTAIYHLDLYRRERLKDGSFSLNILKNQLYSYDLTKDDGGPRRIVEFKNGKGTGPSGLGWHTVPYRTLDNIALSPDAKYIVFSAGSVRTPKEGYHIIVDVGSGKPIKGFPIAYGTKGDSGQPNAAAMVFSPDGKNIARRAPIEAGEYSVKTKTEVIEVGSWKVIRQLQTTDDWISFGLSGITFSPDGKYLYAEGPDFSCDIVSIAAGKTFCRLPNISFGKVVNIFSPDSRFFLKFSSLDYVLSFLDERNCFWLSREKYPLPLADVQKTALSPDGRHIALAGLMMGENSLQIINHKAPTDNQIDVFRRAERALELYRSGLKKEGTAMAKEAVAAYPSELLEVGYNDKLTKAGMPLFLLGELYRRTFGQESRHKYLPLGMEWENRKGALTVTKIYDNMPLQKAGMAVGDIIARIGGEKSATIKDATRIILSLPPDQSLIELEIIRNGRPVNINVKREQTTRKAHDLLMEFAQTALEAQQPAIAMESVNMMKGWIRDNRISTNRDMDEHRLIIEASALAMMGKEEDAFALLIRHNGFHKFRIEVIISRHPTAYRELLRDRRKLAAAMMVEERFLPPPPKNTPTPQPYPDLAGKIIQPLTAPPVIGTVRPSETLKPAAVPAPAPGGAAATTQLPARPVPRGTVLD